MMTLAVYLNCNAHGGGAFQYAREVLEALRILSTKDWKILVYYHAPEWGRILQNMGFANVHLTKKRGLKRYVAAFIRRSAVFMPARLKYFCLRFTFPSWWITEHHPDVVFVAGQASIYVSPPTRQIAAVHDLMHIYEPSFPEASSVTEYAARTALYGEIVRSCSSILVDSPLGKEHLLDSFPARNDQVHVVPFVPPTELLTIPSAPPTQSLPESFFFYPAQFWQHKNHCKLLDAFKIALESVPHMHCVFTGATIYNGYSNVLKIIKDNELQSNVTILGYVDDAILAWLYRTAKFMIYPSFFGPTNIPPLEAMLMGCPVAVSNRYAMPWQCGDAALYFDPSNPYSIADTIKQLWSDANLRRELQKKGTAKSQQWTQTHFHQRIIEILQQVKVSNA